MDLGIALKESKLGLAEEAIETLAQGGIVSSARCGSASCADLERVYGARYRQLLSLHGEHPTLLTSGISEMLNNLRAHPTSMAYSLTIKRGPKDVGFLIIVLADTEKVVGCVRILKNYEPYS